MEEDEKVNPDIQEDTIEEREPPIHTQPDSVAPAKLQVGDY